MTLIDSLRLGAAESGDRPAVIFGERVFTYGTLLDRAEVMASALHRRSVDRFGCAVEDVAELVALLCASSAAGSEACVYPGWLNERGIDDYARAFDHRVVVTDRSVDLDVAERLDLGELVEERSELPPPTAARVLILTTGTTGRPKGARHDWTELIAAVRAPTSVRGARWLLAYNLNQFGGLQVLLYCLVSQGTLVVPSSSNPSDVVSTIREHEVTHVSATPTFWRMVVSALDEAAAADLAIEQITIGGDVVPDGLLEDLHRLFPGTQISQIYAATEFGSAVSVRDGRSGLPLSVLERGDDADVQLRVVDGQLYVRSHVGMRGYHEQDDVADEWHPTGDLVEIRGDRIHFIGRSGVAINVGGTRVHPLRVEELVNDVSGVQLSRAYGRPNPITGEIVAVDVVAEPTADAPTLEDDIREACQLLPPPARPRRIRFVDELDVRDHKLARGERGA